VQAVGTHDADAEVSRSFLFVPADSERKLQKARSSGADALILDLEDSVAESARPEARRLAAEFLQKKCDADVWVRINPLDSADALEDLKAIMPAAPGGIVLPKPRGAGDATQLAKKAIWTRVRPASCRWRPSGLQRCSAWTNMLSRLPGSRGSPGVPRI
jgi:citrate lyase beta subunit